MEQRAAQGLGLWEGVTLHASGLQLVSPISQPKVCRP